MLLIFVPRLTNRVGYTFNVVFRYLLKTDFEITTDVDIFNNYDMEKLCYAPHNVGHGLFIRSVDLLFQTTVEELTPRCVRVDGIPALFPVHHAESVLPFDVFAATFFMISRYEEYLPHITDMHGRFPAHESVAFREGFLMQPVVDQWALMLAAKMKEHYPSIVFPNRSFAMESTVDIDAAYCYKHKGLFRTLSGLGKDIFAERRSGEWRRRMRVLMHKEQDPFDTFDYIIEVHARHPSFRLIFFPLMADYNVYDKSISYQNGEFRQLLQHLGDYAKMGLHASYASRDNPNLVAVERERLDTLLHRHIVRNRYHFLRLVLPESYNVLMDNGIHHDYTMGYAEEPGFRSGTGTPYPFFDLESDAETQLFIHPFAVMDTSFAHYKKWDVKQAEETYRTIIDNVYAVGGTCSLLWHNQNLCEMFGWEGWRGLFERTLDYADPNNR